MLRLMSVMEGRKAHDDATVLTQPVVPTPRTRPVGRSKAMGRKRCTLNTDTENSLRLYAFEGATNAVAGNAQVNTRAPSDEDVSIHVQVRHERIMEWRVAWVLGNKESRLVREMGINIRSLIVLASTPHHHVRWTGLCTQVPLVYFVARGSLLEQAHRSRCNSTKIAASVRRDDTEKTLASFFGQVWLLEHALGGIDVR